MEATSLWTGRQEQGEQTRFLHTELLKIRKKNLVPGVSAPIKKTINSSGHFLSGLLTPGRLYEELIKKVTDSTRPGPPILAGRTTGSAEIGSGTSAGKPSGKWQKYREMCDFISCSLNLTEP